MDKIIKIEMDMGGNVAVKFESDKGEQKEIAFSGIRCGLSWPIETYPGYFCLVGLLSAAQPGHPNALLVIKEEEHELAEPLMESLINVSRDLRCHEIFTDLGKPEWNGYSVSFGRQIRQSGLRDFRLSHVRFAENFGLGQNLIKLWGQKGALKIPEGSIIHQQLLEKEPPWGSGAQFNHFYAINALRYVAMAFERIPAWREREKSPSERERVITVGGWS